MSDSIRLQTQLDQKLKVKAENLFRREGLSLNDGVRLLLTQLVKGNLKIGITTMSIEASERTQKKAKDALKSIQSSVELNDVDDLDPSDRA